MYRILFSVLLILTCLCAGANNIETAKKHYADGEYDQAVAILEKLVAKTPKDAAINYYLGASYYKMGYYNSAKNFLKVAENANWAAAARDLAELNTKMYDLDAASADLDRWEAILDKAKKPYPAEIDEMRRHVMRIRNMLERVEKIQIVSIEDVDSVEFFKYYKLSADAGTLSDASVLPDEYAEAAPKVVYQPQSGKEMFWGRPDAMGGTEIVVADVFDDGSISEPRSLGDEINETGVADFPFVCADGLTIYYGAKGEDSLGGYDIFMTRRSPDGSLLQPQNIGMPYNSLDNDYMMVIDEVNNLGWWASDRNHLPGRVTIYTFVPSSMRVNHNPEGDKIQDYALAKNIETTGDLDQRLVSVAVDHDAESEADAQEEFFFPMANGKVYTRLSQFKNPQARQAMKNLLKRMFDFEVMQAQLDELRMSYAKGDKKVADEILSLERTIKEAPAAIERLTNQIISLESK